MPPSAPPAGRPNHKRLAKNECVPLSIGILKCHVSVAPRHCIWCKSTQEPPASAFWDAVAPGATAACPPRGAIICPKILCRDMSADRDKVSYPFILVSLSPSMLYSLVDVKGQQSQGDKVIIACASDTATGLGGSGPCRKDP